MALARPRDGGQARTQPVPTPGSTVLTGPPTTAAEWDSWFWSLVDGKTPSLETLEALRPEFERVGVKINYNARGTAADIIIPGYGNIDIVRGFEGPESERAWQLDLSSAEPLAGSGNARDRGDRPVIGTAVPRDDVFRAITAQSLQAAQLAARRQRMMSVGTGRQSTIIAGWNSGRPATRPTVLGAA